MELTITPTEAKHLRDLHAAFQKAEREFAIGFTMAMAARDVEQAAFVGLTDTTLLVRIPEAPHDPV